MQNSVLMQRFISFSSRVGKNQNGDFTIVRFPINIRSNDMCVVLKLLTSLCARIWNLVCGGLKIPER